jgi:enterobactin synthetase component D
LSDVASDSSDAARSANAGPALFPSFVSRHTIFFDADDPSDLGDRFPGIELPPSLARAVRKRQTEFLAGRFCVREALRVCAPEHAASLVGVGPHREPVWPPGIVGSVTHAEGLASAAVARRMHLRSIGLDAEQIIDPSSVNDILESIACSDELARITRETGWTAATALTAIFSAKEALFKCLFPEVRRYFDFRDAWLDAFALESSTFRIRLLTELAPSLPADRAFAGRFAIGRGIVHTAIVVLP